MMIGGISIAPTTASRCSTICFARTSTMGVGSAFSASTSTSKPG